MNQPSKRESVSRRRGASGFVRAPSSFMSEAELLQLAESVARALGVFQEHKPDLTAREISIKSLLMAVDYQVHDQLRIERSASRPPQ